MTPEETDAVEALASLPWFADSPATVVAEATAKAAQHETGIGVYRPSDPGQAAFWTHVACGLVAVASSPHVTRGAILSGLVERYGDGLPLGS